MEQQVPVGFVTWLLGAIITLLTGCWAIFKYFESQINKSKAETDVNVKRLYERLDENKKSYYSDFVLVKVFQERNDAMRELSDAKFDGLVRLFNEKIESLRAEIKNLAENHKNNNNNH